MGVDAARHYQGLGIYAEQRLRTVAGAARRCGGTQLHDAVVEALPPVVRSSGSLTVVRWQVVADAAAGRVLLGGAADHVIVAEHAILGQVPSTGHVCACIRVLIPSELVASMGLAGAECVLCGAATGSGMARCGHQGNCWGSRS